MKLSGDALHHDLRRHHPATHALAHQGDGLLAQAIEGRKTRDPGAIGRLVGERQTVAQRVEGLNPAALVERNEVRTETVRCQAVLEHPSEKLGADPIALGESIGRNRPQPFERPLIGLGAGSVSGKREISPTIIETSLASKRGRDRIFDEAALPLLGEEAMERRPRLLLSRIGTDPRRAGASAHEQQHAQRGEDRKRPPLTVRTPVGS